MADKFYGGFEDLLVMLKHCGVAGAWRPEPNGVYMLRCEGGAMCIGLKDRKRSGSMAHPTLRSA